MTVSAEELEERTGQAAARYAGAGLIPGDRVLFSAATSVEMVVAYVGALRAGLTVVPANTGYSSAELATLAAAATPAAAVLDDPSRLELAGPVVTPALAELPAGNAGLILDTAAADDTALIIYTSGTTGRPKGVPLSHGNLLASAHAVRIAWRWTPDDTLALCLPLFHVHGLGVGLHGTLVTGAAATLIPASSHRRSAPPSSRGDAAVRGADDVPRPGRVRGAGDLGRLRLAVSGSAPLAAELHAAIRAGSGQVVLERYGMTETVMLVSNPYEGERRPGTVGFPLPGVSVRLEPREGGTAEIQVRGPNVITGYLDNPGATVEAYTSDGWFRTGDLGTVDDDGYLTISGRAKELIITGGYNVYPREVEELLRTHPGITDAAIVGAPSTKWGETVVAFVCPRRRRLPHWSSDLDAFCEANLVSYKRPRGMAPRRVVPPQRAREGPAAISLKVG
jgi:malonyl-CoA/methylmalonyl-CoA synthetase